MGFPASITQGDSASWTDDVFIGADNTRYTSAGYALKYELRGAGDPVTLTAAAQGSGWLATLTAVVSKDNLLPGEWYWAAIVTAGDMRLTVARGAFTVEADLTLQDSAYDGRSFAERALADAQAALGTFRSTNGKVKKFTIGMRTFEYSTVAELLQAISYWKLRVENEKQARGINDGLGNPKNLYVRFR